MPVYPFPSSDQLWAILSNYAEMYKHDSAVVTTIQQVNDWHLVNGFTTGLVGGGWVFHAGCQLTITAQANNGDGKTEITAALHTLIDGDVISIANTTSYDGIWIVEQVTPNTFVIDTGWVANEGAKTGEHGSHFQSATTTSTGIYLMAYSFSVIPANPNDILEVLGYLNATQCIKCKS